MEVTQIAPGLWRWSSHYGAWGDVVGSVYCETRDGIVLVDPLVPKDAGEEERFWRALDRDVQRIGGPIHILVTVFWHARSTDRIASRYGARVWAPRRARAPIERRTGVVTDVYRPGDPLPGGIKAMASGRATEVVLWIPEHRALVPGDVILGGERGGLRLCPDSWLPQGLTGADLRRALRPLLDLPIRRVLVSHGAPVLRAGRRALELALAEPG
jgi:glyoxylase-like metal-dependent hydrolase (beta-lactamase superfamily II)